MYNGLDCCITVEVLEALRAQFNRPPAIYEFEKALQGPYMEIMLRGFKVAQRTRTDAAQGLRARIAKLELTLQEMARTIWFKGLNVASPKQLQEFFYGALHLPEQWINQKGQRKLSTNREALERLEIYLHARPIIACILTIRDLAKQLQVFETEIDPDGRFRTSYNIAGTECISGDSLVWTKGGLRRMEEIYSSPHSISVWNGTNFVTPVRKVKYPNKNGFTIRLENGYELSCSENHPVLTGIGFVEAKDLQTWQSVQINVGLPELFGQHALPREGLLQQMSEDFCEFYGMILADGSLNVNPDHKRCRLSNSSKWVRDRFLWLVKQNFSIDGGQTEEEAWFSSTPVCKWLKELGFPADSGLGIATFKTIPAPLLRGKPNLLRALLRGLTLDTHITEKGIIFGTQSLTMREQIQQILLSIGIESVKIKTGDSIKLTVPRAYCGRFISIVGFIQQEKLLSIVRILNHRCQWHEPNYFGSKVLVKIDSIRPWQGDVYDLTMPPSSPPQYVAQGMTVHNTGRPSSSENAFGTGGNAQNISPNLRHVFVSDPGYKLCVIDLEQVEARDVGFFIGILFNDWTFLDSCESGDLHTSNAKLIWPELAWTGNLEQDRRVANALFYRDFSYRDMAKRGSHLSNYSGSAWTASRALKVPLEIMEEFQARYCRGRGPGPKGPSIDPAFPGIPKWWQWVATELQSTGQLCTPFGRRRHFFGRPGDDTTLREAIAFLPQSTTADRMNLGLWRVWKYQPQVQLLAQTYDSITFQVKEGTGFDDEVAQALALVSDIPLFSPGPHGRKYSVPGEAKVGWNWGGASPTNPDGLVKWSPSVPDLRKRQVKDWATL